MILCSFIMQIYKIYLKLVQFGAFLITTLTICINCQDQVTQSSVSEYCYIHNVSCTELRDVEQTCLGTKLPYKSTSLLFIKDASNLTQLASRLNQWSALRAVPECWEVIQPFLCSVYMPKCEHGVLQRSGLELCRRTRLPCKIVSDYGWPEFLECEAEHFQPGCVPFADQLSFNKSSSCAPPLINTDNPGSWYSEVSGCGLQCQNPLFTDEEHESVHTFIAVFGSLCLMCTLFAVLTFVIDWRVASKYPSLILFFINVSFFLGSCGWMAQFAGPGAREAIVCRRDGTMRTMEPQMSTGETPWCTLIFFMVYFFMMAGVMWFVVLAFAWYLTFQSLGTPRDEIDGKTAYFHIMAWSLPFVLSIISIAITQIDGDSLSGICFVGYINHGSRAGLVLTPVGIALALGLFFLVKGLLTLIHMKRDCPGVISDRATNKIRNTVIRIGLFSFLATLFVFTSFIVHVYIFTHEHQWRQSFKDYIICVAKKRTDPKMVTDCVIKSRPHLGAVQMNIMSFFGAGIAMSSWVWTRATWLAWSRLIRRILRLPQNDPVKLKKHRAIAMAFARRHGNAQAQAAAPSGGGGGGASFVSAYDDPVGIKIDLNSASSHNLTSGIMAALPKLVRRRGGVLHPAAGTLRRFSDSDIHSMASYMSRRMSGDSARYDMPNAVVPAPNEAKNGGRWTRRTKVQPIAAPITAFHKQQIKLHKRHEAALERRQSVSSISSDREHSSAAFDRNLPLPPIGVATPTRYKSGDKAHPVSYSIFTASSFAPGQLRKLSDPFESSLPNTGDRLPRFKKPTMVECLDDVNVDDLSDLE